MHTKLWQIIKDDSRRTFEVCGQEANTNHFTNKIIAMQRAGMNVTCVTLPVGMKSSHKANIKFTGYTQEDGLYDRLLKEFQKIKDKEINEASFDDNED
jgi:hypothetical protein